MSDYKRPSMRPDQLREHNERVNKAQHSKHMTTITVMIGLIVILSIMFPYYFEGLVWYIVIGIFGAPTSIITYFILADLWWGRR